jgi:hypothetical protein
LNFLPFGSIFIVQNHKTFYYLQLKRINWDKLLINSNISNFGEKMELILPKKILMLCCLLPIVSFFTLQAQDANSTGETALINVNPDPNGEPWMAGGITREQWAASLTNVPELGKPPQNKLGKILAKTLPAQVDNSTSIFFRPIFNQQGGACAQASTIGYVFTYELNFLRRLPGTISSNQYPYDYTYNFLNSGSGNNGSYPDQAWALAKATGIPSVASYGGFGLGKFKQWVTGYPVYFNAMTNRIDTGFIIKTSTADGVTKMKQWLNDHQKGDSLGGCLVMCYNATGEKLSPIKTGLPGAGNQIMYQFGTDGGHAITIVGYNDSIRYDYNNDGKYTNSSATDVKTWEIGAYLIVNSWGKTFGTNGKAWIPYRMLATSSGVWESTLYGMKTKTDSACKPQLTYKIVMTHNQRSQIRIRAGYANSATATAATGTPKSFSKAFNYAGGAYPMQGINTNAIEIGLDVSDFVPKLTSNDASLFLLIDSKGGTGQITSFSVLDYTSGDTPLEIPCPSANINIPTGTTTLKVTRTLLPILTITPNGGETFERGRTVTIAWYDHLSENVKIELQKGSATTTIAASAPSNGSFNWTIPADLAIGSDYKVKISSVSDATVSDASDSAFSIKDKTLLDLTSPAGGEYLEKGKPFPITWNTNATGDFVIDLYKDKMPETTIVATVKSTSPYMWTPSVKISSGNTYTIRIASKSNPLVVFTESDNFFTIVNPIVKAPMTQNFDSWSVKDSLNLRDNWEQSTDDELDWYVHTGPTPSRAKVDAGGTGPTGDHTTGKGNFIYLESSIPNNPSKSGNILSPMFDISGIGDVTIGFWYHMLSKEGRMGHLYVDVFTDGVWNDSIVHFTGDQGDTWHQKVIRLTDVVAQTLKRTHKVQLRFRGITATDYDGDICLDDFRVEGITVPVKPVPPASLVRPEIAINGNRIKFRNATGHLSIIAINGKKVMDANMHGNGVIDVRQLPNGVYCLKFNGATLKFLR